MGGGGKLLTSADKVGGSKKGQKHADVYILEWSLKMALGEIIRRYYECSPFLSLSLCVKNSSKDRFL